MGRGQLKRNRQKVSKGKFSHFNDKRGQKRQQGSYVYRVRGERGWRVEFFHKAQTRRHLPGGRPMGGGRIMLPPWMRAGAAKVIVGRIRGAINATELTGIAAAEAGTMTACGGRGNLCCCCCSAFNAAACCCRCCWSAWNAATATFAAACCCCWACCCCCCWACCCCCCCTACCRAAACCCWLTAAAAASDWADRPDSSVCRRWYFGSLALISSWKMDSLFNIYSVLAVFIVLLIRAIFRTPKISTYF